MQPSSFAASSGLAKYALAPPQDMLLNPTLGYADVYPQRPHQDEDLLTESNAKEGFKDRAIVQKETFSLQDLTYDKFHEKRILQTLSGFVAEVQAHKQKLSLIPRNLKYKIEEVKRSLYASLHKASDGQTLLEIVKNPNMDVRADRLIDFVIQKQVPILRAVLYCKAFCLVEQMSRLPSGSSGEEGCRWWTGRMWQYQDGLLAKISSSSGSARGNSQIATAARSLVATWRYSMRFLLYQNYEGLIDQKTLLLRLTSSFAEPKSDQTHFLVDILKALLDDICRTRTLTRILIESCVNKLGRLGLSSASPALAVEQRNAVLNLLCATILKAPDSVISPQHWLAHERVFKHALGAEVRSVLSSDKNRGMAQHLRQQQLSIECRNRDLLDSWDSENFADYLSKVQVQYNHLAPPILELQVNESIYRTWHKYIELELSRETSSNVQQPASLLPESPPSEPAAVLRLLCRHVHALCDWAVHTPFYKGFEIDAGSLLTEEPRPLATRQQCYFVMWMLSKALASAEGHMAALTKGTLQDILLNYLDKAAVQVPDKTVSRCIASLFSVLVHTNLFSYTQFLERLVARGDLEYREAGDSRSLWRAMLLKELCPLDLSPHYSILCDNLVRHNEAQSPQSQYELAQTLVMDLLQPMFKNRALDISRENPRWDTTDEYIRSRKIDTTKITAVLGQDLSWSDKARLARWIVESCLDYKVKDVQIDVTNWRNLTTPGSSLLNVRQFCAVVNLLEILSDPLGILEVSLWMLQKSTDKGMYPLVIDALRRHEFEYLCFGRIDDITEGLTKKYQSHKGSQYLQFYLDYLQLADYTGLRLDPAQSKLAALELPGTTHHAEKIPMEFKAVRDLVDTPSSIHEKASELYHSFHNNPEAVRRIFLYDLDLLRKSYPIKKSVFDFRRKLEVHVEVLRQLNETSLFLDDVIIDYLKEHYLTPLLSTSSAPVTGEFRKPPAGSATHGSVKHGELLDAGGGPASWFITLLVLLVCRRCCSPLSLLKRLCEPLFRCISSHLLLGIAVDLNLLSNVVLLTRCILVVDSVANVNERLFLTQQDLHALHTIRHCELRSTEGLCCVVKIFHLLAKIASHFESERTPSSESLPVIEQISITLKMLTNDSCWFKRAIHSNLEWSYENMIAVLLQTDLLPSAPEPSNPGKTPSAGPSTPVPTKTGQGHSKTGERKKKGSIVAPTPPSEKPVATPTSAPAEVPRLAHLLACKSVLWRHLSLLQMNSLTALDQQRLPHTLDDLVPIFAASIAQLSQRSFGQERQVILAMLCFLDGCQKAAWAESDQDAAQLLGGLSAEQFGDSIVTNFAKAFFLSIDATTPVLVRRLLQSMPLDFVRPLSQKIVAGMMVPLGSDTLAQASNSIEALVSSKTQSSLSALQAAISLVRIVVQHDTQSVVPTPSTSTSKTNPVPVDVIKPWIPLASTLHTQIRWFYDYAKVGDALLSEWLTVQLHLHRLTASICAESHQ
ncbi:uncharacterized protein BJ171DRAFT_84486 [Polychytrium aggregatum]|uniref:uncharacterized protein n=1 Tax=Polychytrium aggregatum TaxID=110093 RepID=UPI0022FF2D29|nr:uncharacterized protein BJ171DRAFT_84486 [Polychytrium aggregatum]KAI9205186.1 hypothetical protein BJ171DRAFT_84486 [Polychytrium aggregatum]